MRALLPLLLCLAACSETQAAPETPPQDQQPSGNKTLGSAIKSLGGALQGSSAVHKTKELLDQVHGRCSCADRRREAPCHANRYRRAARAVCATPRPIVSHCTTLSQHGRGSGADRLCPGHLAAAA